MSLTTLGLIAFTVLSAVSSQTIFKSWSNQLGSQRISAGNALDIFLKILQSPLMLLALIIYGLGFMSWIFLLSRNELSLVYPVVLSINIAVMLIASALIFHESINLVQLLGTFVVIAGIYLLFVA